MEPAGTGEWRPGRVLVGENQGHAQPLQGHPGTRWRGREQKRVCSQCGRREQLSQGPLCPAEATFPTEGGGACPE